jgi:hypothetical protein
MVGDSVSENSGGRSLFLVLYKKNGGTLKKLPL